MEIKSLVWLVVSLLLCWTDGSLAAAGIGRRKRKKEKKKKKKKGKRRTGSIFTVNRNREHSIASERRLKSSRNGEEGQRRTEKASKNGTEFEKDAMADILYENREIFKDMANGKIGHILEEGDIRVPFSNFSARNRRTVDVREGVKWPGGVVPYIVDSAFKDKEKRVIFGAMQRFQDESCIKFRKRTIEPDYVFITPEKGCWSMVGRQSGMQKLSLVGTCKFRKGTIMHELMHCLGFRHEHNRPDRDKYIRIEWSNIENGYSENFIQHSRAEVDTMNTRYDYFSIMHYPLTAFSSNGLWTIQPIMLHHNFGAIGSRHDFSELDIRRVNQLYLCGACTDTDTLYCPVWAMRGECQRNIAWMIEHCPLSCETCPNKYGNTRVYIKNCDDSNDQCRHWAKRGECTRNPSYMERHCRKSCNNCYIEVIRNHEEPVEDEDVCQDEDRNCEIWAKDGLCATHTDYMLTSCMKSCKVCVARQSKATKAGRKKGSDITNEILDETVHRDEDDDIAAVNYCTDLHSLCSDWARSNECITNAAWMAINCPNSCRLCGNSGIESACVDRHQNCTLWATEGDCEQFPNWMLDKCPVSCHFCTPKETEQISLTNVRTVKCRDKKKQCSVWVAEGHCNDYQHWMTVNCPKSCDFCDATINRDCVDKEKKCKLWATKRECRKNKGWFLPNCQFSCNACSATVPSCVDQHRLCRKKAKKGLCPKKSKIRKECPYSCNLCEN